MLSVLAVAIVGLLAFGGASPAAAATPPPPYPPTTTPPGAVFVTVNINIVIINNGTIIFSGGGFDALEQLGITVSFNGPSGLRASQVAAEQVGEGYFEITADSAGSFSTPVTLNQVGDWTLTATGLSSGKTASTTVTVQPVGYQATSGSTGSGADLASTGASIAGPIAIGAAALLAGLALLFFGTRGVIRRKHSGINS